MSQNVQDCYDTFAGEVYYNGISEDAFDADMTDLAELLNGSCTPMSEINDVSNKPTDLFSGSSTLIAELAEVLCDNLLPSVAEQAIETPVSADSLQKSNEDSQVALTKSKTVRRVTKPRKSAATKTGFRKGMSVIQALGNASGQQPNMSRRRPSSVIVAFPAFDKCDSLLYFSTTLIRLLNTADMDAASKLMNKHLDKSCSVTLQGKHVSEMSVNSYKQIMAMGNDIEPDRIMCVHSTKVIENKILSSIYLKVTDVQSLYTNLARTSKMFEDENVLGMGLYPDRARRFEFFAAESSHNEQLAEDLIAYSQREEDVVMYMRIDFTLTVDDMTRKILHFTHAYELTSVHIAGTDVDSK
eukprot:gene9793-11500_t